MSDHERGAYTPPTDAPLSFDARQPVRGTRPIPFTLIISILVLLGLAAAIVVFYRSGVRKAEQPPQMVGAPVTSMKAVAPPEAQPQDPAAGLQIYHSEAGASPAIPPKFTPPPEQPQTRPGLPPPPTVVVTPPAAAPVTAPAPTLRPSIPSQPPATAPVAKASPPAPKVAAKPPAAPVAKAAPEPAAKPAAVTSGGAGVQIGAFSSQALADKGWNDAAAVAPGVSAGKGKSVEKIDKDGKTLFRTTVTGFSSRADAAAFCDRLKAAGKACFVK
ncbi:SPOR domain-containing protein [Phenylobacterium sp.]|uniref:cell division protein FtsN n=1 Tax=Phenylobacterium sp. TaxID=1871053 RepID=UPI00286BD5BF|nr:SPOR domain-containing protein [Phenylobacterium sp.]